MPRSYKRFVVEIVYAISLYGEVAYHTRRKYFDFLSDATQYANKVAKRKHIAATIKYNV